MASKSTFTRSQRVAKSVAKYRELREKLKKEGDYAGLAKLPRDASPTRLRNHCALTGRSRGVYRKFKISRIKLRELALQGKVPGMRKASW
jgi:small subunit ribosomal protein S14